MYGRANRRRAQGRDTTPELRRSGFTRRMAARAGTLFNMCYI